MSLRWGVLHFIYLFNYLLIYLSKLFIVEKGNYNYYMRKTKNEHIIANLHLRNSDVDSEINKIYRTDCSSKNTNQLKVVLYLCKKPQPKYPVILNAPLILTLK